MTSQQHRCRDPQPISRGGEAALVALAGALLLLAAAALIGLGVAAALFGSGWVWPRGAHTIGRVLAGLLTGHPGRGLEPVLTDKVPGRLAVYSCVAATELALLGLATVGAVLGWRYHRPGDSRRGMATRAEAAQVLGRTRLRHARTIIRPDLYGDAASNAPSGTASRIAGWSLGSGGVG